MSRSIHFPVKAVCLGECLLALFAAPAWAGPAALPGIELQAAGSYTLASGEAALPPDRSEVVAGTVYSVFPGYGLGHFILGYPEEGTRFLALELGATAVWMLGPGLVSVLRGSMPDATSQAGYWLFATGLVAWGGLKAWEVVSARNLAQSVHANKAAARDQVHVQP